LFVNGAVIQYETEWKQRLELKWRSMKKRTVAIDAFESAGHSRARGDISQFHQV
jgi:hypothetical protein